MFELSKKQFADIVAVGGAVLGSALMAADLGNTAAIFAYALFLVSSIASVMILRNTVGTKALTFVNVYFIFINTVGIVRYSFS